MIDKEAIQSIQEFVHSEPRTIQDVSKHLNVNWKTAERYVQKIIDEYGTLSVKQFRGSSQSSVKVVYWNSFSKTSDFLEESLSQYILLGRMKYDFHPIDIYQHCDEKLRSAEVVSYEPDAFNEKQMKTLIDGASDEILFFSGNMSWVNFASVQHALKEASRRGVSMKVVTRLDVGTLANYQKVSSFDNFEVRHREQPLRAMIVDSELCQLKEFRKASFYKETELASDINIFYVLKDRKWVSFLRKIFFSMYNSSPDIEMRLKALGDLYK